MSSVEPIRASSNSRSSATGVPNHSWVSWLGVFVVTSLFFTTLYFVLLKPYLEMRSLTKSFDSIVNSEPLGYSPEKGAKVREQVAQMGGAKVVSKKLAFYLRLPNWLASRKAAAVTLLGGCDHDSVSAVARWSRSDSENMRVAAMSGLTATRNPCAVEFLIVGLKDTSPRVRSIAAYGLKVIPDSRAIEPLTALLNDPDDGVAVAARDALKELKIKDAGPRRGQVHNND